MIIRLTAGLVAAACFALASSVWGVLTESLVAGVVTTTLMWTLRTTTSTSVLMRVLRFLVGPAVVGFFTLILIGGGAPWWQAPLALLATQIIGPALARVALTPRPTVRPLTQEELDALHAQQKLTHSPGVFGVPGGVGGSAALFGEAAAIGAVGEKRTAQVLDRLAADGRTAVYHGLRFPGSQNADVDHAVVRGKGVVLIDSKLYAAGTWGLALSGENGKVSIVSSTGTSHENSMPDAAAGFARLVGPHRGKVTSLVVLHGAAATRVDPQRSFLNGVHLCAAADLDVTVERLLAWLNEGPDGIYLAPGILHVMHGQLKKGAAA